MSRTGSRGLALGGVVGLLLAWAPHAASQDARLEVRRDDGTRFDVPVRSDRGYAVVSDAALARLGWTLEVTPEGLVATWEGERVELSAESPFFRWNADLLQLVRAPYRSNGAVWIPVQLVLDFLPSRIPETYTSREGRLEVATGVPVEAAAPQTSEAPATPPAAVAEQPEPDPDAPWGIVVIDPGHGGRDPGSVGPGGRREKDIALSVGRALAAELRSREGLEVRMTRDRDFLVDIWERGHLATEWRGDRPGIFISIHTNSVDQSSVRGFETYFLSEARTAHERRVAENENAPMALAQDDVTAEHTGELDLILKGLRNRDHLRWSSVLAGEIQRSMEDVHPGPSRGVKQGPLAVITNALMPAVLVEVGFISNPQEERLISRGEFQRDIARVIAEAVDRFFARYPLAEATAAGRR